MYRRNIVEKVKASMEQLKLYRNSSAVEAITQKQKSSIAVEAGSVGKSRISLFYINFIHRRSSYDLQ